MKENLSLFFLVTLCTYGSQAPFPLHTKICIHDYLLIQFLCQGLDPDDLTSMASCSRKIEMKRELAWTPRDRVTLKVTRTSLDIKDRVNLKVTRNGLQYTQGPELMHSICRTFLLITSHTSHPPSPGKTHVLSNTQAEIVPGEIDRYFFSKVSQLLKKCVELLRKVDGSNSFVIILRRKHWDVYFATFCYFFRLLKNFFTLLK